MSDTERNVMIEAGARALCSGREHDPAECPGLPTYRRMAEDVLRAADYQLAVNGHERVGLLAAQIERDRREPDKVLMYAQELASLSSAHGGQ